MGVLSGGLGCLSVALLELVFEVVARSACLPLRALSTLGTLSRQHARALEVLGMLSHGPHLATDVNGTLLGSPSALLSPLDVMGVLLALTSSPECTL